MVQAGHLACGRSSQPVRGEQDSCLYAREIQSILLVIAAAASANHAPVSLPVLLACVAFACVYLSAGAS